MKRLKNYWDVVENKNLIIIWSGILVFLLGFGMFVQVKNTPYYGIAESSQQIVNVDYPVRITRIYVRSGDKVRKGDRLLDLDQEESKIRKIELEASLRELYAQSELVKRFGNAKDRESNPLDIQIQRTRKELSLIDKRIQEQYVYAKMDGIVGDINFKLGERVSPFAPILSLYTESTSMIKAYVHEATSGVPAIGDKVTVWSNNQNNIQIKATVVGVGKRVIPFPERLLKFPGQGLWGREVLIKLPQDNAFDLGEKVSVINPTVGSIFIEESMANTTENLLSKTKEQIKKFSPPINQAAASLIFAQDLNKFIVAQENSDASGFPSIQFLSPNGRLENNIFHLTMLPNDIRIVALTADREVKKLRLEYIEENSDLSKNSQFIIFDRDGATLTTSQDIEQQAAKQNEKFEPNTRESL